MSARAAMTAAFGEILFLTGVTTFDGLPACYADFAGQLRESIRFAQVHDSLPVTPYRLGSLDTGTRDALFALHGAIEEEP